MGSPQHQPRELGACKSHATTRCDEALYRAEQRLAEALGGRW